MVGNCGWIETHLLVLAAHAHFLRRILVEMFAEYSGREAALSADFTGASEMSSPMSSWCCVGGVERRRGEPDRRALCLASSAR